MTAPLDEKTECDLCAGKAPVGDAVVCDGCGRAYLSAVAIPDELEVVAWRREFDGWLNTQKHGQPLVTLSQAHSIIAALRRDHELVVTLRNQVEAAHRQLDAAEAKLKRLTEDKEALIHDNARYVDANTDLLARIKALEEALGIASHALMVVQVAIDEDTTALNDVLWVPERFSPNESLLDFVGNARARSTLNSREKA